LKRPFEANDYIAAMLGVLLIGVALWALVIFVRLRVRGRLYRLCQLAFLVVAVAGPSRAVRNVALLTDEGRIFGPMHSGLASFFTALKGLPQGKIALPFVVVFLCLVLGFVVRFLPRLLRMTTVLLLCSSPFLVMTYGEATYAVATRDFAIIPDQQVAPYLQARSAARRLVWVVFDEWDYRLTFVDRDPSLKLDAIDRLRNDTLFAERALPPAGDTRTSMPSYINGRRVKSSVAESAGSLQITYSDTGEVGIWGSQPSVFSKARAMGVNAGVLGWYLPYCRVFGSSLPQCSWVARAIPANTMGRTLLQKLEGQPRDVLESKLLAKFGQSLSRRQHAKDYIAMEEEASSLVTDKRLDLAFVHLPGPHAPFVYDREADTFTRKNDLVRGYID
jgi:hypothetical protein